jgi:hypothetical protein
VGRGRAGARPAPAGTRGAAAARRTARGDELEIDLRSLDTVARWVAGYGPDVVGAAPAGARGRGAARLGRRSPRRMRPPVARRSTRPRAGRGWREAVR